MAAYWFLIKAHGNNNSPRGDWNRVLLNWYWAKIINYFTTLILLVELSISHKFPVVTRQHVAQKARKNVH